MKNPSPHNLSIIDAMLWYKDTIFTISQCLLYGEWPILTLLPNTAVGFDATQATLINEIMFARLMAVTKECVIILYNELFSNFGVI